LGYSYPTDVQYFLDDSALKGEYDQMKKDVEQVIKTARKLK
jgi:hypothetical protein